MLGKALAGIIAIGSCFSAAQAQDLKLYAFSSGALTIGKGGLVKDASSFQLVETRVRQSCREAGLWVRGYFASPIAGGDGNNEFFVYATRDDKPIKGAKA